MTLRGRGIEVKKLNRKRKEKERKKRKMKKREREKEGEREREGEKEEERENFPPDHRRRNPNVVTIHPVAPANYIMIFNGPKSKTRPPKIFGSGISWGGLESSEMS